MNKLCQVVGGGALFKFTNGAHTMRRWEDNIRLE